MSLFDRRTLILALLALPACGFTPVYGPAASLRGAVEIGTPDSGDAFTLVRALELRLGTPENVRYRLAVDVKLTEEGSVITQTQEIDRFTLTGLASYTLTDLNGDVLTNGEARAFTNYSASDLPMATRAARDDSLERLMVILSDQIVARLAAIRS
ncbi:MAG: LPS assembly lipoprotein LptE [Pseudomonadota bacterium]